MKTLPDVKLGASASAALNQAHTVAAALGHDYLDTEHLLLGMMQCRSLVLQKFLSRYRTVGLDYDRARTEVKLRLGVGHDHSSAVRRPQREALTRLFERARMEAATRGHDQLEMEHYLLALLSRGCAPFDDASEVALSVLKVYGVNFAVAYSEVNQDVLDHPACRNRPSPPSANED